MDKQKIAMIVDGVEYVRKDTVKSPCEKSISLKGKPYVIVRTTLLVRGERYHHAQSKYMEVVAVPPTVKTVGIPAARL